MDAAAKVNVSTTDPTKHDAQQLKSESAVLCEWPDNTLALLQRFEQEDASSDSEDAATRPG